MEELGSIMHELARVDSFMAVGMSRAVAVQDGIITPSKVKIPCGATVLFRVTGFCMTAHVHHPDANVIKLFRFAVQRSGEELQ